MGWGNEGEEVAPRKTTRGNRTSVFQPRLLLSLWGIRRLLWMHSRIRV